VFCLRNTRFFGAIKMGRQQCAFSANKYLVFRGLDPSVTEDFLNAFFPSSFA
jgi:hypothetical protein